MCALVYMRVSCGRVYDKESCYVKQSCHHCLGAEASSNVDSTGNNDKDVLLPSQSVDGLYVISGKL